MPATIHNYHLEQIIDRLEGRPVRRIETCGRWVDGERCGRPAVETLVGLIAWHEDTIGVCEHHYAEHLSDHCLA